jgi:phospholipid transport system substrate-binding protein
MVNFHRGGCDLRRWTARLLFVLLALAALPVGTHAAMSEAADKVRGFYDALLNTMRDGPSLGAKGRYERLKPVIGRTFDLPYMARAVVGPAWASASAAEQQEMTDVFSRYVTATYADRFDSFSGEQLQVSGEEPYAANVIVDSRIVKADGKPVIIKYLMRRNGDDWRVVDVFLEGTISELATRRSEFSSIVRQKGIDGLVAVLDQKVESLVGDGAK